MLMFKLKSLPLGFWTGFPLLFSYLSEAEEVFKFLGSLVLLVLTVISAITQWHKLQSIKIDNEFRKRKLD